MQVKVEIHIIKNKTKTVFSSYWYTVIKEKPKTNVSFGYVDYENHLGFLIVMIEKLQLKEQLRDSSWGKTPGNSSKYVPS